MVQMKGILGVAATGGAISFFISHMVQMKALSVLKTGVALENFISHMVQMKG